MIRDRQHDNDAGVTEGVCLTVTLDKLIFNRRRLPLIAGHKRDGRRRQWFVRPVRRRNLARGPLGQLDYRRNIALAAV